MSVRSCCRIVLVSMLAVGARVEAQDTRLFSPRSVSSLEGEGRDEWQQPAKVVEALRVEPSSVIADIGTGSGYFVPHLSAAAGPTGRVYAVDIQQEMLAFVERKIERLKLANVKTVLSQEDDTGLDAHSVDLALFVDVYHELQSPRALMSNIRKILKPNGRLAIIDFYSDKEIPGIGPPLRYRVPEQRLLSEVRSVGFDLVERHAFLPYQYFLIFKSAEKTDGKKER